MNLLFLGEQMSIDYEILLKSSAGSPRHLAVDKTPQQLDDALCCQFPRLSSSEAEVHENAGIDWRCGQVPRRHDIKLPRFGKLLGSFRSSAGMGASGTMDAAFQAATALPIGGMGFYFHKMKATFLLCLRTYLPCIIPTQHEHRRTVLS